MVEVGIEPEAPESPGLLSEPGEGIDSDLPEVEIEGEIYVEEDEDFLPPSKAGDDDDGEGVPVKSGIDKELAELRNEVIRLAADNKALKTSMQDTRAPAAKDEPTKSPKGFTREQLKAILKENLDDPDIAFEVQDELAKLNAAEAKAEGFKEWNDRQWFAQAQGVAHKELTSIQEYKSNPKVQAELKDYARNLGIDKHPMGEYFAFLVWDREQRKLAKTKGAAEGARVKEIRETKGLDKTRSRDKGGQNLGLTPAQLAMAKRLEAEEGIPPKEYARFVSGSKKGD